MRPSSAIGTPWRRQSLTKSLSQDIILIGDLGRIDLTLCDENSDLHPAENKASNDCESSTSTGYTAKLSETGSEEKSDSSTGDDDVCNGAAREKHVSFDLSTYAHEDEGRTNPKETYLDISSKQDETQRGEDLVVGEEYRNEIEHAREVIANLATDTVASLTSEALQYTHDTKVGQVKQLGNCDASCEINCDDENEEEYDDEVYIDMLLKEEEMLLKGEKLHKSNRKLRRRLKSEIKLSIQLSLNLITAAENITKVSKEKDEWKAKYKALEKLYVEESAQGKFE